MMTAIQCPTPKDLKALTLGQLSSEDSDRLFDHVSQCEACRSDLETVEDTGDSLIANLRSPDRDAEFSGEPDCQLAVAKALGTLASAGQSASTPDLQQLPRSIGEYDIVRPIGRGGMGSVYLARHTKLGREVALKVLASHRLADARMRDRFEAEMLAVGRLSHPNIVTAHDAREVNGTAVLVTEFVSGMDLGQLLQRTGTLCVADACEIVRQIAVALSYTHQQGFVHRDIKPSNVMLSSSGEVKLLDLGLARLQYGEHSGAEITGTGQAMGTADYVAPEQVTDSKTVSIRADIYSLGCTLFKLLTGRAPFADGQHTTAFAKMTAHVSTAPPSLSNLQPNAPQGLVSLVDSMLAKDPGDRPQTPEQVVLALTTFCKGHDLIELSQAAAKLEPQPAVNAHSNSATKPATQSWMRRKVPVAAAISAGLLGVLLGLCLSIILIITNPDGTRSILELAEGSKVEINERTAADSASMHQPNEEASTQPGAAPSSASQTPLSFGILVNPASTGRSPQIESVALAAATELLHKTDGTAPVQTEHGTWFEVADDQSTPLKVQNAGKSFALVSNQMITWPEIQGHVLSTQSNGGQLGMTLNAEFDVELGAKFRQISGRNLRNQLAIVVRGKIRVAPTINSEIGEQVAIAGAFTSNEIQQLQQWVHGNLVDASPAKEAKPQNAAKQSPASTSNPNSSAAMVKVYKLSELQIDSQVAYSVLSTMLADRPDVRMDVELENHQLVVLAPPAEHDLVKDILAKLAGEEDSSPTNKKPQMDLPPRLDKARRNLKKIGLAFHNFHSAYGKFPGSANTREGGRSHGKGKKIYPFSWRVAILPFIEQNELFEEYRFDEPWDSKSNLALLDKMPSVYRSPFASDDKMPGESNIIGFAGENYALGIAGGHRIKDFTDGTSNTLLLVEVECSVPWTKPQDIPGDAGSASYFDDHPLVYLLADGSVQPMEKVDIDKLNKMISRNGGETIAK